MGVSRFVEEKVFRRQARGFVLGHRINHAAAFLPEREGRGLSKNEKREVCAVFISLLSYVFSHLLYVANAGSFPQPLSAEEERELVLRMEAGDETARGKLIEHNLRLVAHIVKKYYSGPVEQDDLISIGTIGLIKAVSTFNSRKGIRLATYAARCIDKPIRS